MELKKFLQQPFPGFDAFRDQVIIPIFGGNYDDEFGEVEDILQSYPQHAPLAHSSGIRSIYRHGHADVDFNPIYFYDIEVESRVQLNRNRVAIQQLIHRVMGTLSSAFLLFHYPTTDRYDWRFTFCSKGKNTSEFSDSKRYTFILGPDQACRTAAENFEKLILQTEDVSFKDIIAAFDVEALSNEFFTKYKKRYEDFVQYITGKRFVKESGGYVEKIMHDPHPTIYAEFGRKDRDVRDYVKKLFGRIVFLHFLQKKGWLGVPQGKAWGEGDLQFMKHLFDQASPEQKANYLDGVLEPLFEQALNTERGDSALFDTHVEGFRSVRVPYLNGGLFERDEDDKRTVAFPTEYFQDLFEFLYEYNFTIDENDPNDSEVGIDPEMLGKIFENLLEDNKDKGAFYTPKEIVQYMCRESLIAYLTSKAIENNGGKFPYEQVEASVRKLILSPEEIAPKMNDRQKADFGKAIREVKICDPAIGSGAFPMGLLNELVRCRVSIDAWALDSSEHPLVGDYAALKREIVSNNIYGVDIEKGAIDIARLRFWLSIIVDEEQPHPLPNFDYKFMQGNSLIPTFDGEYIDLGRKKEQRDSKKGSNAGQEYEEVIKYKRKLYEIKKKFYTASGEEKLQLSIDIKDAILDLIALQIKSEMKNWVDAQSQTSLLDDTPQSVIYPPEKQHILDLGKNIRSRLRDTSLSLAERAQTDIHFFDWRMMFTEVFDCDNPGFDILIGNPPYIQLQANGGLLADLYENHNFKTFVRTGDIYSLFYELGYLLLKVQGHLCYITSNKWMKASYGEKTRLFFSQFTYPKLLIDFTGVKIFENATVDTNILLFSKAENLSTTWCCETKKLDKKDIDKLSEFVQTNGSANHFVSSESWVIRSHTEQVIKEKTETTGKLLKEWNIQINYGIKTGCNDAFIITSEQRNVILSGCIDKEEKERTEKIICPLFRGKDIKKYTCTWPNLWIINTHNGVKGKYPPIDINNYPSIKQHLDSYWDMISKRGDKGDTPYNLRNCAYLDDFYQEKISYREIGELMDACLLDPNDFVNNKLYIIVGEHLHFLIGVLNSSLFNKIILQQANLTGGKGVDFLNKVRVPLPEEKNQQPIISLVDQILSAKKSNPNVDTSALESQIDELVYDLYGLSEDEKEIVRNA